MGRNAFLTRAWRLCWAGRACAGSPQNTKACVTVNSRDMLKYVLWCPRAQHTGTKTGMPAWGTATTPSPLHCWWQVHPASKALTLKDSDGPFAWRRGRGAVGAGASVLHVFQRSALFLFYAAFPWRSESGEAGCDGEESGERAEEKGNRMENGKM